MNRLLTRILLLPFLLLSSCMPGEEQGSSGSAQNFTCPMHPQIVQEGPGTCPICFMDLVPVNSGGTDQEIMLSPEQIALADIRVAPVARGDMAGAAILAGKLKTDQETAEVISSRVAGRIEKLYVRETGQLVRKGQPLYEVYSEELLTLQREYLLTVDQYRELGGSDPRYASLMDAARQKLLLYGMDQAAIDRLAESGQTKPAVIFSAPASGLITEIAVTEGQYISGGSYLYRLEGTSRLWVEAELYPGEAAQVEEGSLVSVFVNGFGRQAIEGKVVFLQPEYRAGTQIRILRAQIDNPDGQFMPGMQASIMLDQGSLQTLAVPSEAVIREEGGAHAWIKTGPDTFVPRLVRTGRQSLDEVEITAGLEAGDSLVISGAYLLYSELVLKKGKSPLNANKN